MWKRTVRFVAWLLALLFLFAGLASVMLECAHADNCPGADCRICQNIEMLRRGALALFVCAVFLRSVGNDPSVYLRGALRSRVPFLSPVACMVRMND